MSAPSPIQRLEAETEQAWRALVAYCELGVGRTYRATAEALGHPENYTRQLKKWAKAHRWRERAASWDAAEMAAARAGREAAREAAYARLYDAATGAADQIVELSEGKHRAGARPSVQLQACIHILAQAGMVPPKRTELVVDKSDGLDEAREAMDGLTVAQLTAILEIRETAE